MVPVILGPTAAGKSALALAIASQRDDIEIVNADSRQIYIGMDIGTAKPTREEQARVCHHLIDIVAPDIAYSAGQFAIAARAAIEDIIARGKRPLVAGGSGFYIKALFEGLRAPQADSAVISQLEHRAALEGHDSLFDELSRIDPAAATHSANNRVKTIRALACFYQTGVRYSEFAGVAIEGFAREPVYVGITMDREQLYETINERAQRMIDDGLVDETRRLIASGIASDAPGMRTVGYKESIAYLDGLIDARTLLAAIQQATRRYAKRQLTWFRGVESVRWFDARDAEEVLRAIEFALSVDRTRGES